MPSRSLSKPNQSQALTPPDGRTVKSSSLDDFLEFYLATGRIESADELLGKHLNLCSEIQFQWLRQKRVACIFARVLASKYQESNWDSIVVSDRLDSEKFVDRILTFLDESSHSGAEAIQLLFPHITGPEDICELLSKLCESDRFYCTEVSWPNNSPKTLLLALRWILPGGDCVNWALGTADIQSMPPTRHAPFVSIVFRSQELKRTPSSTPEQSRQVVHLADMDDGLGKDQSAREKRWESTKRIKAEYTDGPLCHAARAKVTFSLPLELRDRVEHLLEEPATCDK